MTAETMYIFAGIGLAVICFIDLVLCGQWAESFSGPRLLKRNVSYSISALTVLFVVSKSGNIASQFVFHSFHISKFPVIDYVGCFAFAELMNWIFHYFKHRGFLWRFHFQHHLAEQYNIFLTTHTHGLEVFISGIIISVLMGIIGFSPGAINAYFLFYSLANTYQHMSGKISLGFIDYLIVSPQYHRIHHSKGQRANYGSTLTLWDIVFHTAHWPDKGKLVQDIGIHRKGEPFGFLPEFFYFLKRVKK